MRKLITASITGTIGAPLDKPSLDNVQSNFTEVPASIAKGILGSYTTNDVIIWDGFVITLSNSNNTATWTAGSVFYNGEFYQVAAGTSTKSSGVFLYSIVDTITTTQFDDGNTYDWLENKTITITHGTSGTGIADYGDSTVKNYNESALLVTTNGYTNTGSYASYKKTGNKVNLSGVLTAPGSSPSAVSTVLPASVRPAHNKVFILKSGNSGGAVQGYVHTNGNVDFFKLDGTDIDASDSIYIDGINYDL